ncbi:hypothetical protein GCM10022216_11300 [Sphingobacterium kyonggiense]|uniref:DUF4352 domain-containing protein n=1 Tax=Sphingobacterium kyonggiense TaxID=714075 RepID=A0ABP7YHK9_9SPHI
MNSKLIPLVGLALLLGASCTNNTENKDNSTSDNDTVVVSTQPDTVIVQETVKEETAPQITSIASKQVDEGTLAVTKAHVVGSILSIDLVIQNPEKKLADINIPGSDIYYIDDATAKKNSILKDDAGKLMLSPVNSFGDRLRVTGDDNPILMNLKFAAPPADSKTISLSIGKYGSFDGMPITR